MSVVFNVLQQVRIGMKWVNPTKWSNTLKQFIGNLPTNCLSVFGHFVWLALKVLKVSFVKDFQKQSPDVFYQKVRGLREMG